MLNSIIDLLPSQTLKEKIKECNYPFSEVDLLCMIIGYAPTFEKRLDLLTSFAQTASPENAGRTMEFVKWQKEIFRSFCEDSAGSIYELHVKYAPDGDGGERYICASYEAALKYIDLYYDEYSDVGAMETEKTRYKIVKRRIYTGDGEQGFCEDEKAVCWLGQNKTVLSVIDSTQFTPDGDCDSDCGECTKLCNWRMEEILFPCFLHDRDVVTYTDDEGQVHFGVCFPNEDAPTDQYYIIPFDSNAIRYHAFSEDFNAHKHIRAPLVDVVPLSALDDKMREDYLAYMKYLDSE